MQIAKLGTNVVRPQNREHERVGRLTIQYLVMLSLHRSTEGWRKQRWMRGEAL